MPNPSPSKQSVEEAREIVKRYRQMHECFLTDVEFLEARIALALDKKEKKIQSMEKVVKAAIKWGNTNSDLVVIRLQEALEEYEKEREKDAE